MCSRANADEGMWTFHGFPLAKANAALKTQLDQAWLDRVRSATVRLSNCTGSFVSSEGLILTNHHCVESCLAELSSKEKSLVEDGFLAKTREEEKRCQTQVADVLTAMEDVTAKVSAATAGKDGDDRERRAQGHADAARKRLRSASEAASARRSRCTKAANTGSTSTSVTPTCASCSRRRRASPRFGGDPDNFQFPRWCLDMGLLRAYEDGKPATLGQLPARSTSPVPRPAIPCSCRAIPAPPTAC